jgi:hypothetical protein
MFIGVPVVLGVLLLKPAKKPYPFIQGQTWDCATGPYVEICVRLPDPKTDKTLPAGVSEISN